MDFEEHVYHLICEKSIQQPLLENALLKWMSLDLPFDSYSEWYASDCLNLNHIQSMRRKTAGLK